MNAYLLYDVFQSVAPYDRDVLVAAGVPYVEAREVLNGLREGVNTMAPTYDRLPG
jgi:hypothetical protein